MFKSVENFVATQNRLELNRLKTTLNWALLPAGLKALLDQSEALQSKTPHNFRIVSTLFELLDALKAVSTPAIEERASALKVAARVIAERIDALSNLSDDILSILNNHQDLCSRDTTSLIDHDLVKAAYKQTADLFTHGSYDLTDLPILLRLQQLKFGSPALENLRDGYFGHIVLDEAQDMGPLELSTIISSVKHSYDLTIVGDVAQSLDPNRAFPGWKALRDEWNLGEEYSRFVSLTVSHRSTLPIMRLADHVIGENRTSSGREGKLPVLYLCQNERLAVEELINWLNLVREKYPTTLTAVICRDRNEAHYLTSLLDPTFGASVRQGDEHNFSFESGIIVTDVNSVKGLEFHSVMIWNPGAKNYPQEELSKNLLYVAITRAQQNVSAVAFKAITPLLPPSSSGLWRVFRSGPED